MIVPFSKLVRISKLPLDIAMIDKMVINFTFVHCCFVAQSLKLPLVSDVIFLFTKLLLSVQVPEV